MVSVVIVRSALHPFYLKVHLHVPDPVAEHIPEHVIVQVEGQVVLAEVEQ